MNSSSNHLASPTRRPLSDRPSIKLSERLIDTYKNINRVNTLFESRLTFVNNHFSQVYYEQRASRLNQQASITRGGVHNNGYDDPNYDYILIQDEVILDRYVLKQRIGKGSFGQVVCAYDKELNQEVAIKIIKSKRPFYIQAQTELELLQIIQQRDIHDESNIVRLLNHFVYQNHQCFVFEMLSYNLYHLLKNTRFRGISLTLIRKFTKHILKALSFLSSPAVDIVHCDLKPENILLKHPHRSAIKLIDFGSSCHQSKRAYTYIQSRFYRSPEVLLGLPYDQKIDMWSLGCVLVEMHVGEPLFAGNNPIDQMTRIVDVLGMPPADMLDHVTDEQLSQFFEKVIVLSEDPLTQPSSPDADPNCISWRLDGTAYYILKRTTTQDVPPPRTLEDIIGVYSGGPQGRRRDDASHSEQQYVDFLNFIKSLLIYNPVERASPDQALLHPYITALLNTPAAEPHTLPINTSIPSSTRDMPLQSQFSTSITQSIPLNHASNSLTSHPILSSSSHTLHHSHSSSSVQSANIDSTYDSTYNNSRSHPVYNRPSFLNNMNHQDTNSQSDFPYLDNTNNHNGTHHESNNITSNDINVLSHHMRNLHPSTTNSHMNYYMTDSHTSTFIYPQERVDNSDDTYHHDNNNSNNNSSSNDNTTNHGHSTHRPIKRTWPGRQKDNNVTIEEEDIISRARVRSRSAPSSSSSSPRVIRSRDGDYLITVSSSNTNTNTNIEHSNHMNNTYQSNIQTNIMNHTQIESQLISTQSRIDNNQIITNPLSSSSSSYLTVQNQTLPMTGNSTNPAYRYSTPTQTTSQTTNEDIHPINQFRASSSSSITAYETYDLYGSATSGGYEGGQEPGRDIGNHSDTDDYDDPFADTASQSTSLLHDISIRTPPRQDISNSIYTNIQPNSIQEYQRNTVNTSNTSNSNVVFTHNIDDISSSSLHHSTNIHMGVQTQFSQLHVSQTSSHT